MPYIDEMQLRQFFVLVVALVIMFVPIPLLRVICQRDKMKEVMKDISLILV